MKTCTKCGLAKPPTEYHRASRNHDGLKCICKACALIAVKAYRTSHISRVKARQRVWGKANAEHKRVKAAEWNATNPERVRATRAAWNHAHKEEHNAYTKAWRVANPENTKARNTLSSAIRRGVLPPASAMVCRICGEAQAQQYHHHNGYGPGHEIDVIAVCRECHLDAHRK